MTRLSVTNLSMLLQLFMSTNASQLEKSLVREGCWAQTMDEPWFQHPKLTCELSYSSMQAVSQRLHLTFKNLWTKEKKCLELVLFPSPAPSSLSCLLKKILFYTRISLGKNTLWMYRNLNWTSVFKCLGKEAIAYYIPLRCTSSLN